MYIVPSVALKNAFANSVAPPLLNTTIAFAFSPIIIKQTAADKDKV